MDERKLLLTKREINKLIGKIQREGLTIVPTKMYFKKGKAKLEIAYFFMVIKSVYIH